MLVKQGDSVTLHTNLTEIQKNDVIVWRFGLQKSLIAKINGTTSEVSIYDDDLDGRFRDRLQVNNQTGDLTITNITTQHTGLYEMIFNSAKESSYRFNVTAMLVKQGASVTLHTHLTEIQKNDVIEWSFGPQGSLIARINGATSEVSINADVLDGRFRDRLQVNDQTGDLIITDTKTKDSGLYQMSINSTKECLYNVTVYVSVMEGDSLTLHTDIKLQRDDQMLWRFGTENSLIAKISGVAKDISIYDDVLDGRFKDRLQVNTKTGDLIITNITTNHTGLYQMIFSGKQKISYGFSVTVYAHLPIPVISKDCTKNSVSSNCSLLCSVLNVRDVSLSWYKGNSLLSNISVSDLNIRLSLPLEVEYQDTNTYSCVLKNTITKQTQHLNITQLCQACSNCVFCCQVSEAVIRLVVSALVGVAAVAILVYDIRSSRVEQKNDHRHHPTVSDETFL
ncbi:uncharacterized protein [Misgurnus anguillicaudatus]|uniref:uncharacterized protein n=1 Tax=Misgurnus anguillicaudatus TaxID=75329 RepID=UPI003CCF3119